MFNIAVGLLGVTTIVLISFVVLTAWFLKEYMIPLIKKDLERTTYVEEQGRKLKSGLIATYNEFPNSKTALMFLKDYMKKEEW